MKRKSTKEKMKATKQNKLAKESSPEIISLILRDHKPIKELILVLKDPDVGIEEKQPAYSDFEKTLSCHAKAEEESLYLHLKEDDELRVEGIEGDTEHEIANQLMFELNQSQIDDDTWMAKVKVLAELLDHHVKEEEKEVLKQVEKDFSLEQRQEIGETYSQLFDQYQDTEFDFSRQNSSHNNQVQYAD